MTEGAPHSPDDGTRAGDADPAVDSAEVARQERLAALLRVSLSSDPPVERRRGPAASERGAVVVDPDPDPTAPDPTDRDERPIAPDPTDRNERPIAPDPTDRNERSVAPATGAYGAGAQADGTAARSAVDDAAEDGAVLVDDVSADDRPYRPLRWIGVLASLAVAGVVLIAVGAGIVRNSTQGRLVDVIDDPTAPGYEAFVERTPTLAVFHTVDGSIDAVSVLILPNEAAGGGSVVTVPVRTVADLGILGVAAIENAYELGEPAFLQGVVGELLGTSINEYVEVSSDRWAQLVAPVAPITVDNPSNVRRELIDGTTEVIYPVGEIELAADEVAAYLETPDLHGGDRARIFRHEVFWAAWIDAVAASTAPDAVPGEIDSGIGRFVRGLARGEVTTAELPVRETEGDIDVHGPGFEYLPEETAELTARLVPLPSSAYPGHRAKVRVLNGTAATENATTAALRIPPAGAEIVVVGNATSFDHDETVIAYFGEEFRDVAESIRELLGTGEVIEDPVPTEVADITVTLGSDFSS